MYYAFLGNQYKLSMHELEALTGDKTTSVKQDIVSLPETSKVLEIADKLGGTTKISKLLGTVSKDLVVTKLEEIITAGDAKNVAISNYTNTNIPPSTISGMKERIVLVRPVRFVSFQDRDHELLMLSKRHVAEYNLIDNEDGTVSISNTVWIYDSMGFAARDRKKPYQDIKRGMLPVKLARMMVNLAVMGKDNKKLLDPFCGTGTVLNEALMVGCQVVGSDIDKYAVDGARENIDWLQSKNKETELFASTYVQDALHIDELVPSVDCVVTEPLMGPLLDSRRIVSVEKVKNIARGLDKLYRGVLRTWWKMLPEGGRVVMTIPTFEVDNRVVPTILVDTIRALGYNYVLSVAYSKPGATVIRNITVLEKAI